MSFDKARLLFMPRGLKILSVTKSAHDFPVTFGMISPAVMKAELVYPHLLRKLYIGFSFPIFSLTSAVLRSESKYIKSPWKVSNPNRWQSRSRMIVSLATQGSYNLKSGSHFCT